MLTTAIRTLALVAAGVSAHGILTQPPSRSVLATYHGDTEAGLNNGGVCSAGGKAVTEAAPAVCQWWGGLNSHASARTLPDSMRTWSNNEPDEPIAETNPWFAPGSADLQTPCGSAGANSGKIGMLDMPAAENPTTWKRGESAEVAIGISANHGGGYAFRLCPTDGSTPVTEACFRANHLAFVGNTSWIQHGNDTAGRQAFPTERLSAGTVPAGSQWTRNPIPGCTRSPASCPACYFADPPQCTLPGCNSSDHGGNDQYHACRYGKCDKQCSCPIPDLNAGCDDTYPAAFAGTQFPPPFKGYSGGSTGTWPGITGPGQAATGVFGADYSIVDLVHVPASLKPGAYLLSWRWDCEQSPEVFVSCADIHVV